MGLLGDPFCIVCGGPGPLGESRRCAACVAGVAVPVLLPDTMQLQRCRSCDQVLIEGRWVEADQVTAVELLVRGEAQVRDEAELISWELGIAPRDERNTGVVVEAVVTVEGIELAASASTLVRTSYQTCGSCSRRAGRYFEATVQLRSSGRELSDAEWGIVRATLDELLDEMEPDPLFFVTEEATVRGGRDVVLGSKALARQWTRRLSDRWGGIIRETSSIVGRRDGIDLTRLTVAWRKPAVEVGDVVRWRNDLWRANSWTSDGCVLRAVDHLERKGVRWRDLESAVVEAQAGEVRLVPVIRRDEWVVEVSEPETWQPMELARPDDDGASARGVRVAFINDRWMAVPRVPGEDCGGGSDADA